MAPSHPPSPGLRDFIQLRSTSTKSTSVSRDSATSWPGRSTADSLTIRCRMASSQPPSAVGFRRSTGGSNSSTAPYKGRDTVKLPQIIVEAGCAAAAVTNDAKPCRRSIDVLNRQRPRLAIRIDRMRFAACDDDKVALAQVEVSPLSERQGRRTPTEIMEQGVGPLPAIPDSTDGPARNGRARSRRGGRDQALGRGRPCGNANPVDGRTQYLDDLALSSEPPASYVVARQAEASCDQRQITETRSCRNARPLSDARRPTLR